MEAFADDATVGGVLTTIQSGGEYSDEYTCLQLIGSLNYRNAMYLGTREGHIFYWNATGAQGAIAYNFSSVFFASFNIGWALPIIR